MKTITNTTRRSNLLGLAAGLLTIAAPAMAQMGSMMHMIDGLTGQAFTLTAKDGYISTADGNSVYFWGYANGGGGAQYVGPTLILNQGDTITVTLNNELPVSTSIVFPGQSNVIASLGAPGLLTREAPAKIGATAGTVKYTFVAAEAGTYQYHSGTQPDLQVEMGLVGAIIVRPVVNGMAMEMQAYSHPDTMFDHEFLFLLTDMDETIHDAMEIQVQKYRSAIPAPTTALMPLVDTTKWYPVYWFINGRTGPDTMADANVIWLPAQPYNCMPMFHPGERVLMRVIGGGRDAHPLHHHGNHSRIIARDGRLLESTNGVTGPDLSQEVFTIASLPGGTVDSLFSWTGEKLGWDAYGHLPTDALAPFEYPGDHGKAFPVKLPINQDLTFGAHFGGTPFLGSAGILPPGEGGFNPNNAFPFMWHSHNEKEIVNNNIFPGGMLTMAMVEAWTPLEVTPAPLPAGTVGSPYAAALNLTTVGGMPAMSAGWMGPYTWSLAMGSGELPPGLVLNADGTFSGTPTTAGTYIFTVYVNDSMMNKGAKALTITVN